MTQRPTARQPGIPVTAATVTADQAPTGPVTTVIAATTPAIPAQRAGETAEPEPPRTFTLRNGATLPLPEPAGCTTDHTEDRFPEDVTHELGHVPGIVLPVDTTRDGDDIQLLEAGLHIEPYVADERCRKPHVLLEGALGEYMEPLDADRFGQVIADLHAHLDRLTQLHERLTEATAEWEASR